MIFENNLKKCLELVPEAQAPAMAWLRECHMLGMEFNVAEVYRSQERQDALYAQGRTAPGKIVTWTKSSMHTQRKAMDIDMRNNYTLEDMEDVAKKYKIYRPKELIKIGDLRHFQLDQSQMPQIPASVARRRAARDALSSSEPRRSRILRRISIRFS
jgi:hypothetical protein